MPGTDLERYQPTAQLAGTPQTRHAARHAARPARLASWQPHTWPQALRRHLGGQRWRTRLRHAERDRRIRLDIPAAAHVHPAAPVRTYLYRAEQLRHQRNAAVALAILLAVALAWTLWRLT